MRIWNNILNRLDSFSNSTYLKIELENFSIEASRLNSNYYSRKKLEFSEGHNIPKLCIIKNDRYSLGIVENMRRITVEEGKIEGKFIPSEYIYPIFNRVNIEIPKFLQDNELVYVFHPDFFKEFDKDGKPVTEFRNTSIIYEDSENHIRVFLAYLPCCEETETIENMIQDTETTETDNINIGELFISAMNVEVEEETRKNSDGELEHRHQGAYY